MDYQLIRSKRKTLSLQINNNAELVVRAPNRLSVKRIEQFIDEKSTWIDLKMRARSNQQLTKPDYKQGEAFLYLGNTYPLNISLDQSTKLDFNGVNFESSAANKAIFLEWYKAKFREIALPRLNYYAQEHQLAYQQVRLKSQKTLWGSCSGVNNINLNYLLVRAPIAIIDYVIVHELAHIKHKNHSKDFWNFVAHMLPNYKASKRWLQDNGHKLKNL
ncbi:peptide ABC transporter ATPase [Candidatus Thioglobus autotrophicus]|uniref:Peptide ABC transporter ATPase n=1 Tax=Candidatus Thioglobus autotrophicus TaxID=1705394 RepID=A0A0M4NHV0_9GAMM|nr:SprT family zinc-dependent metalloprotease [Candidatus Thioglobus autotrophicus]ALE51950.1 peptide ABC transporter ATPase [Candidatus Thioglobus autotrophicus]